MNAIYWTTLLLLVGTCHGHVGRLDGEERAEIKPHARDDPPMRGINLGGWMVTLMLSSFHFLFVYDHRCRTSSR
jgi:hypothetical protein